jgi:glucosamine--fructose-6-phosphate aminotransferase (isomerizing)
MTTAPSATAVPGRHMRAEMGEQGGVVRGLLGRAHDITESVGRLAAGSNPAGVAFLARGSSGTAALLGRYAVEMATSLPTSLVSPSIVTAHGRRPWGYASWLLVALSQSGRTPEIVTVAAEHRRCGATVLAVTNDADSPLAEAADLHLPVDAGPERAVPATKTVTGQMLALALVAIGLSRSRADIADLMGLGPAVDAVLGDTAAVQGAAAGLREVDRLAVVGRGWLNGPAHEIALKIQETTGAMAHGFSTADFRHGPIAATGGSSPAVLLAGSAPTDDDTRAIVDDLRARRAHVVRCGTGGAAVSWPAAGGPAEAVLATIRGQQLAYYLCRAKGLDPDFPAGLDKVTLTH